MKNQVQFEQFDLIESYSSVIAIAFLSMLAVFIPSHAQSVAEVELPQEREIHNTFSRDQKNGAIIDATNPMDLINRLRQATAMDNATTPSDAIDEALKAFSIEELEATSSDLGNSATN